VAGGGLFAFGDDIFEDVVARLHGFGGDGKLGDAAPIVRL